MCHNFRDKFNKNTKHSGSRQMDFALKGVFFRGKLQQSIIFNFAK